MISFAWLGFLLLLLIMDRPSPTSSPTLPLTGAKPNIASSDVGMPSSHALGITSLYSGALPSRSMDGLLVHDQSVARQPRHYATSSSEIGSHGTQSANHNLKLHKSPISTAVATDSSVSDVLSKEDTRSISSLSGSSNLKSKVLIIYCGGTIGMKWTDKDGYIPAEGWLHDKLASMPEFHDYEYMQSLVYDEHPLDECDEDILMEYLATLTKEELSSLQKSSIRISNMLKKPRAVHKLTSQSMVISKSSQLGSKHVRAFSSDSFTSIFPQQRSSSITSTFSDTNLDQRKDSQKSPSAIGVSEGPEKSKLAVHHRFLYPWLVTPKSVYDKRIFYRILEYAPLLDSSNMTMEDWVKLATDIETFYSEYDSFIILHGTDTMAYTSSALSFMLEELGKSVILTGSQISICEFRNDGINNLIGALTIAGHFVIPEVTLFFSNKLYRGNRVSKVNAVEFAAFDSPNMKPLVELGIHIDVSWNSIYRPWGLAKMRAHKALDPNVATLRLFPGIPAATVAAFLSPPIKGIVLETFGVGNAPSNRPDLLNLFHDATTQRDVVIINVTQCNRGQVHSDIYNTGRQLIDAGVVPGRDMTIEAALTKLAYLLAKDCYDAPRIRQLMTENIRGELTLAVSKPKFSLPSWTSISFTLPKVIQSVMQALSHSGGEKSEIENIFWPPILASITAAGDTAALCAWENANPSQNRLHEALDSAGKTLLHIAAENGLVDMISFLLYHGLSVHACDIQGHTPLMKALLLRHMPAAHLLIRTGAKVPAHDVHVFSLFYEFILEGQIDYAGMLLDAGLDAHSMVNYEGKSALYAAIYTQKTDIIEWLLSKIHFEEMDLLRTDICHRTVLDEVKFIESKRGDNIISMIMRSRFPSLVSI
jgi:lysophospholipase